MPPFVELVTPKHGVSEHSRTSVSYVGVRATRCHITTCFAESTGGDDDDGAPADYDEVDTFGDCIG